MGKFQKLFLFLLRVSLGWVFFYAGIIKILDPKWSSIGYLENAQFFPEFYERLSQPDLLPLVDMVNEWGLTLLGISLILGIGVRLSSVLGAGLMLLYYFPILDFPKPNAHSFIIDDHIIYAVALLYLAAVRAGRIMGLEKWCENLPICRNLPKVFHSWWG